MMIIKGFNSGFNLNALKLQYYVLSIILSAWKGALGFIQEKFHMLMHALVLLYHNIIRLMTKTFWTNFIFKLVRPSSEIHWRWIQAVLEDLQEDIAVES